MRRSRETQMPASSGKGWPPQHPDRGFLIRFPKIELDLGGQEVPAGAVLYLQLLDTILRYVELISGCCCLTGAALIWSRFQSRPDFQRCRGADLRV